MTFCFTSIGNSSAVPAHGRISSAHILNFNESYYLLDCAEGTQIEMMRLGIKRSRIRQIMISHLHGDHYLGLSGLLNTMNLLGHRKEITLHAFEGLAEILELERSFGGFDYRFPFRFESLAEEESQLLADCGPLIVRDFPVVHRIPCKAFLFTEPEKPVSFLPENIAKYGIPVEKIAAIKSGEDFKLPDGRIIPNRELTLPPPPPRKFAYVTDTRFHEPLIDAVRGFDVLYHEATFMEKDADRAEETFHCTSRQAAIIAREAGVGKLILGHFSAKYKDLTPLLEEARAVFPETYLSAPGRSFDI